MTNPRKMMMAAAGAGGGAAAYAWGENGAGQLGIGTTVSVSSPVLVESAGSGAWTYFRGGPAGYAIGLQDDGTLWACGNNVQGTLGNGGVGTASVFQQVGARTDWEVASGGNNWWLGITTDGKLWHCGDGAYGQNGNSTVVDHNSPTQVGTRTDWAWVSAGDLGSCSGITDDGKAWTWGDSADYKTGQGTLNDISSPTQLGSDTDWIKIHTGKAHGFGFKATNQMWGWGEYFVAGNAYSGRTTPANIGISNTWASLVDSESGRDTGNVIKSGGTYWCWGRGGNGGLGQGNTLNKFSPMQLGARTDWIKSDGGPFMSNGITSDGKMWVWGLGTTGAMGQGDVLDRSSPTQIGSDTDWTGSGTGFQCMWGIKG
jgi:alpha-tubulin suppressor-like RCC1 family protein